MKRDDISLVVTVLLLISICVTGILGYIQSQLELRKFVPHRYFAYATLSLAGVHIYLHAGKLWRNLRRKFKREKPSESQPG